jgi:hypothetical protein
LNEKNVGEVADNIVIFFRAKAVSRNSFISTNPYKFAVKKQRLSDGDISTWNEEADSRKDQSKTIGKRVIQIKRYGTKEQRFTVKRVDQ